MDTKTLLKIVQTSINYVKDEIPYCYGKNTIEEGMDCAGLTMRLFKDSLNLEIGRTGFEMLNSELFIKIFEFESLTDGDIIINARMSPENGSSKIQNKKNVNEEDIEIIHIETILNNSTVLSTEIDGTVNYYEKEKNEDFYVGLRLCPDLAHAYA